MRTKPELVRITLFGPFEYEEGSGQIRKHGNLLRLQGKPLQILSVLIGRPGQIVGRDELQQLLWGGTPFGDFEQGLNSAVNKLRQTLGDSADQPRYIETVPGQGYRFIAPVHQGPSRGVLEIASPAPLRIEPRARVPSPRKLLVAVMALAAVAMGAYWLGKRSIEAPAPLSASKVAITPPPGFVLEGAASRQAFALSPDASRLAFTAMDSSGEFSVFLRDFNSLESRMVAGSNGAHTVFWPPDQRTLYLVARGKLWRTSLEGDAHVLVTDSPSFMFSGAWLSPEKILLDSFRASYVASPSGGPVQKLKEIYLWPNVLPDGEHALYVRWDSKAGRHRAHVLRLNDFSTTNDLMETDSRVSYAPSSLTPGTGYLLYVRGGTLLAHPFDPRSLKLTGETMPVADRVYSFAKTGAADFSVSRTAVAYQNDVSRSQLIWVDRSGREVGTIGPADISAKSARLSPDGRRLATAFYDVERGEQDIWTFDVATNSGRRLTADAALRDAPVWSPDSKTLAFLTQTDGDPPRIHLRGLRENDVEEIMPAADFQLPTDWSPDGRFVVFVNTGFPRTFNEIQSDVWILDLARGRKALPLLNTRFHEANPTFSPDGKWLAFTSNESGRAELYVQAFRSGDAPLLTGDRYLVSSAGAAAVRWRRDGKELFYMDLDGRVQAVSVRFAPRPEFGPATSLFTISTEARAAIHSMLGFDVSLDGNRFVVVKALQAPTIIVTQNWEALLPHRPGAELHR